VRACGGTGRAPPYRTRPSDTGDGHTTVETVRPSDATWGWYRTQLASSFLSGPRNVMLMIYVGTFTPQVEALKGGGATCDCSRGGPGC
jgi:hypothetical protein